MDVPGSEGEGLERVKRSWSGAKRERVPVPVRSGRCSPSERMRRIRERYWSSSWAGGVVGAMAFSVGEEMAVGSVWRDGRESV